MGFHLTLAWNQSEVLSRRQQMTAQSSVMKCDGALHDPAVYAEPGAVFGAAPGDARGDVRGDVRGDFEPSDLVAVALVVVAVVGVEALRAAQRLAPFASDRRDGSDQWDQLGHVVAVAAGQRGTQRDAVDLHDHVVLEAGLAPVHRGRAGGRTTFHRPQMA